MNALKKKYSTELFTFSLVFVIVFSELKFNTTLGSNGSVEQWVNLTNQMFYGKQDFLFSYGPLFWLTGGATSLYDPFTYWLTIVAISTLDAFFWALIFTLSYKARAYAFFAIAYFLFFSSLILSAALFLWPLAAVAYCEFSGAKPLKLKPKTLFLIGTLVALSFYVRFFYGTVALATFGSYLASQFFLDRKPKNILLFVSGIAVGYIAIGTIIFHSYRSLIDYLIINNQLSFGNSVDMTLEIHNSTGSFLAAAFITLCINIYILLRRRSIFLTVNVLLLIFFKIGFSRTDHYVAYFVIPAAVLALVLIFDKSKLGRLLFVLVMGGLYYLAIVPSFPGAPTKDSLLPQIDFATDYVSRMQKAYTNFKLDDSVLTKIGASSIDVYPYNNEYAIANNLTYQHRPVFQNYMTLTPTLDAMNQAFFESAKRPKYVLWTAGIGCSSVSCNPFEGFDQKWALNEDPLTTSAILLNYHVVDTFPAKNGVQAMLLEENSRRTAYSVTSLSTQDMTLGKWYKVPRISSGVAKLIPQLNFTILGRLSNTLFRGGILKIKYKLVSGEVREYRTNILNSRSGIWVSPLPDNFKLGGPIVDSIMLDSPTSNYFQPTFKAQWVRVPILAINPAAIQFDEMLPAAPNVQNGRSLTCDGSIDAVNGISPVAHKLEASGSVKIQGWLASSAKDGITTDQTLLTLTDGAGKTRYVSTHAQNRPDVGAAYKRPDLSAAGYESLVDISALSGSYTIGLAEMIDSKLYRCPQFQLPLTVTP